MTCRCNEWGTVDCRKKSCTQVTCSPYETRTKLPGECCFTCGTFILISSNTFKSGWHTISNTDGYRSNTTKEISRFDDVSLCWRTSRCHSLHEYTSYWEIYMGIFHRHS